MDDARFTELLETYRGAVERYAHYTLPNAEDARDVCQETFLAAWRYRSTIREDARFQAWLIGIARNKLRDRMRARVQRPETPMADVSLLRETRGRCGVYRESAASRALSDLTQGEASLLSSFYGEGAGEKELAARLGLPVGTVKSRLSRARRHFKAAYGTYRKERSFMMPSKLTKYEIIPSPEEAFPVTFEENGWLTVPRAGEKTVWASYDQPGGALSEEVTLVCARPARIHGETGVEIEVTQRQANGDVIRRVFVDQLADGRVRTLAERHESAGVQILTTFLDPDFISRWGDPAGDETNLAPAPFAGKLEIGLRTIAGRYTVTLFGRAHDAVRVLYLDPDGALTENYVSRAGRTLLERRFNRDDWSLEPADQRWSERLPVNERQILNGDLFVHWYDCVPSRCM